MFSIVRLAIGVVLGIWWLLIAPKITKIPLKRRTSTTIIIADILLLTILNFVPFENLVYTFKSPEAACKYYNPTMDKVELVVEGYESDLVVGKEENATTIFIVPKTADGWKTGTGLNIKSVIDKHSDGIIISVYQYRNSSDYFISIIGTNGKELTVSDKYNTAFLAMEEIIGTHYYAYLTDFNSQYSLTINGNEITLQN